MKHKVLIFGADGQLGKDLARSFSLENDVFTSSQSEADVTNEGEVLEKVEKHTPSLVINCAAFTNVEANEKDIFKSLQVNAVGAAHIARSASKFDIPLIYISTDFIFDGTKEFFKETDFPNPLNVYGTSKYTGELLTKIANDKTYIIRTSSLFGSFASGKGYNFVDKIIELGTKSDKINVVEDNHTSPTYARDLAEKILELVNKSAPFGTYHITNQGSCTWYEFALEIIKQKGLKTQVVPISAKDYGTLVARPLRTVLANENLSARGFDLLPPWKDALKRYLEEKSHG